MKPIALQLYTLREAAKSDFVGVLKKVAAMGYKGVEPAGFHNLSMAEFRKVVEDLGMKVCSSHGPSARPENLQEVIDAAGILGLDVACCGYGTAQFDTREHIRETAQAVAAMARALRQAGITLFQHNHYWEYAPVDGRLAIDWYLEDCGPDVTFEMDAYWSANHGANDPVAMTRRLAARIPLLHVKDGPLKKDTAMLPLGTGKLDIPGVIGACDEQVLRWVIVELDRCDCDMVDAVAQSYAYLTRNRLAAGNR